jgi:hypothetical protein
MLRMARATKAMRMRAMIASIMIGLHCCRTGCADVLRLPPPAAYVDRDQPRFDPEMHPASIRVNPGPAGFQNSVAGTGPDWCAGVVDALAFAPPPRSH